MTGSTFFFMFFIANTTKTLLCQRCTQINVMELIKCNECGQMVSDIVNACPNCGAPIDKVESIDNHKSKDNHINASIDTVESIESSSKVLKLVWKGKSAIKEYPMEIIVNGKLIGAYSYNSGFEVNIPINSESMEIVLRMSGRNYYTFNLTLNTDRSYICNLVMDAFSVMGYELKTDNGLLIKEDKLGWGMRILSFLIPIIGIVIFFVNKNEYPAKSKSALMTAFISIAVSIVSISSL